MVRVNGARLRQLRHRQLVTLRELAELSGVSAHTIYAIEVGKQEPRAKTLRKLCLALSAQPEDILVGFDEGREDTKMEPRAEGAVGVATESGTTD